MSEEVKKDAPLNDDGAEVKVDATPDANAQASSDAEDPTTSKKPRGIGFLGRRGTAPIRTDANPDANNNPDNKDADAKQAENAPPPLPLGFAEKTFVSIGKYPVLAWSFLVMFLALQSLASIWYPSVLFMQELNIVEVYSDMKGMGQWLVPTSTEYVKGMFPVFFWFMALVDFIPLHEAIFLPLLTSLTALFALSGTYTLALYAGLNRSTSFAAGLLLLVCPLFLGLNHMVSPELFAAGLLAFALAFLGKGWCRDSALMCFIIGFFCTALVTLSGGFLPFWTILISSLLFIIWRATFGRANQIDSVLGFGVLACVLALWLVFIIISGGPEASALDVLMQGIIAPFMPPYWPLEPTWSYGLLLLALGVMPWLLLPFFASWVKIFKNSLTSIKASRKENSGISWLYINGFVGCVLLVLSGKFMDAIILLPIFAILLAKTLCNLSTLGSRMFYAFIMLLAFLLALLCAAISFMKTSTFWADYLPEQAVMLVQNSQGLEFVAGLFLVLAVVLFKFTKREFAGGSLLVVNIFILLILQPFTVFFAPNIAKELANTHPYSAGQVILEAPATSSEPKTEPVPDIVTPSTPEAVAPSAEQAPSELPAPSEQPTLDEPAVNEPAVDEPAAAEDLMPIEQPVLDEPAANEPQVPAE